MCTLVALVRAHPERPLVVFANRDERHARPASAPHFWDDAPGVIAGRDLEAGGTWLGATRDGRIVGLTNRRGALMAGARSRGELVHACLASGSVDEALTYLRTVDVSQYARFQLFVGGPESAWSVSSPAAGDALELRRLDPGVHVFTNAAPDVDDPKRERVGTAFEEVASQNEGALSDAARGLLADHQTPSAESFEDQVEGLPFDAATLAKLEATCVHLPGYGTVSAAAIWVDGDGLARYEHAEGAPCRSRFEAVFERG